VANRDDARTQRSSESASINPWIVVVAVGFGILHVIGGVIIHDASSTTLALWVWRYLQGTCYSEDIVGVAVVRRGRGSLA
jgi:hypothetical protein